MEFNKKSVTENVNNPSTSSSVNLAVNGNDEQIEKQNYVEPKQLAMLFEPLQLRETSSSMCLQYNSKIVISTFTTKHNEFNDLSDVN